MPAPTDTIRRHVVVSGRVQGVSFRWFTREQARSRGLSGWVRNNPDGTVEAVAEGPSDAVAGWLAAVRQGPPMAYVDHVEVSEDDGPPLQDFRIR